MQVNAVIQQHGDLGVLRLVAQDRPDPIVCGEDGRDDLQFAGFSGILRLSAAGKDAVLSQEIQIQLRSHSHHSKL